MTKLVQPTTKLSPKFIKVQLVYARAKMIEVEIKQSFWFSEHSYDRARCTRAPRYFA